MFPDFDGFDVEDWMIIGPLSEELEEEEQEQRRQQREDEQDLDNEEPW